jgi:hypothetical protein
MSDSRAPERVCDDWPGGLAGCGSAGYQPACPQGAVIVTIMHGWWRFLLLLRDLWR